MEEETQNLAPQAAAVQQERAGDMVDDKFPAPEVSEFAALPVRAGWVPAQAWGAVSRKRPVSSDLSALARPSESLAAIFVR